MSKSTDLFQVAAGLASGLEAIGINLAVGIERRYLMLGREQSKIDVDANADEIILTLRGSAARLLVEKLLS